MKKLTEEELKRFSIKEQIEYFRKQALKEIEEKKSELKFKRQNKIQRKLNSEQERSAL
ncbi:hypothetical protein [Acinetobacter pollinis]|uniref:hypothetical protein n=1 Tax=Acinetobacter pollinis TaxID=2605270 RepID=UPI0018A2DB2B|nr:hypothetical protein [Acinetobacter pollinis]MBF7691651.1 hypothetical protein [Acinetobacter pollinis]MBF7699298.1 hypothetical protein [Acinetobacter pollinis]